MMKVVIVVGHEAEKIEDVLQGQPVRFVENLRYMEGMTSSIQTGIQAASAESEGLLICLADQPFIETSDFNRLIHEFTDLFDSESSLIIVPVFKGQRGNPVLFSRQFRDIILQHKGEGCRDIVLKHPECVREVEMGNDNVLQDVDTPEDYKLIKILFEALYPQSPNFNFETICEFLDSNPELLNINKDITQKPI